MDYNFCSEAHSFEQQLERIRTFLDGHENEKALEEAKQLQTLIDKSKIAHKNTLQSNLLHVMGAIFMSMGDFAQATDCYKKGKIWIDQLMVDLSLAVSGNQSRTLGSLGISLVKQKEYSQALDCFQKKLGLTSVNSLEACCLLNDIAQCQLELGSKESARDNAKKALEKAEELKDATWTVNSLMLLAQGTRSFY